MTINLSIPGNKLTGGLHILIDANYFSFDVMSVCPTDKYAGWATVLLLRKNGGRRSSALIDWEFSESSANAE
jgi:hypothetical protein